MEEDTINNHPYIDVNNHPPIDFVPKGDALNDDNSKKHIKTLYITLLWLALPLQTLIRDRFGARYLSTVNVSYAIISHVLIMLLSIVFYYNGYAPAVLLAPFLVVLCMRYWVFMPFLLFGISFLFFSLRHFDIEGYLSESWPALIPWVIWASCVYRILDLKSETKIKENLPENSYYYGNSNFIKRIILWELPARIVLAYIFIKLLLINKKIPTPSDTNTNENMIRCIKELNEFRISDYTLTVKLEPWLFGFITFIIYLFGSPVWMIFAVSSIACFVLSIMQQHAIKRHYQDLDDVHAPVKEVLQQQEEQKKTEKTVFKASGVNRRKN